MADMVKWKILSSGQWTAREVRKIAVVSSIHDANTLAIA
jgi:hypothetical protein